MRSAHDDLARRRAPRLRLALATRVERAQEDLVRQHEALRDAVALRLVRATDECDHIALRLKLLDPRLVLQRGYALLSDASSGKPVTSVQRSQAGQVLRAQLAYCELDLRVLPDKAAGA